MSSDGRLKKRFEGQVAAVTGAANGIGAAVARQLIDEGAKVMLSDIQDDVGAALVDKLGENAAYAHCDVQSEDQIEAMVAATVERWGGLNIMHNNAGLVGAQGPIEETGAADWARTIEILLTSVFLGTKHAAPHLRAAGGGAIVNTASVCGITGGLGPHAYTAAKHAVVGLTKSTALELADDNIRVNAICPGYIVTELTAGALADGMEADQFENRHDITRQFFDGVQPLSRAGEVADIAAAVAWLASDESSWMTGVAHVVDGGLTAGVPFRQRLRSQFEG